MQLPRVYRLNDTRVVLHKELAYFLGFHDNPIRDARRALESALRLHQCDKNWPVGSRFVLKGVQFREFNALVHEDYGARLTGKHATVYTAAGVSHILNAFKDITHEDSALVKLLSTPIPRATTITPPSTVPSTTPNTVPTGPQLNVSVFTFDGDKLECTTVDGEPFVTLQSLCAPFGKRVDAQTRPLARWGARTHLGWVRLGSTTHNLTLLHAEDVPMFIARLDQRGMTPEIKAKHERYIRRCAIVLPEHFGHTQGPPTVAAATLAPTPALATPPIQTAPVATLSGVMVAFHGWVKEGKISQDMADRYIVDYMQRNGVVDFSAEPPPLPDVFLIKGRAEAAAPVPVPLETTNGNTVSAPFKASVRGPFERPEDVLKKIDKQCSGLNRQFLGFQTTSDVRLVAIYLQIFEHSFWGKHDIDGTWLYDVDAVRKIVAEVERRVAKAEFKPATT